MQFTAVLAGVTILLCSVSAQAEAPRDVILNVHGKNQLEAFQKAILPYVEKARATYPAAKKRFLAGLIPKGFFSVWLIFGEIDPQTGEHNGECLFVKVESIKNGLIIGRINNKNIKLKRYHYNDRVQVAESNVGNWVINRLDGSEEGNYVGKFLKHWRLPKS